MTKGIYYRTKQMKEKNSKNFGNHSGRNNYEYREIGTIIIKNNGYQYIKVKEHKWERYHRYLVEQYIGRKLKTQENIHHIDGNKLNNELSNFYICNRIVHVSIGILIKYKVITRDFIKSNLEGYKNKC